MMANNEQKIDVSLLNRHQRRAYAARTGVKVVGRNMPFVKAIHKTWDNYNKLREKDNEQTPN